MKHTYQKPVITLDAGMAEGVYAASGAGNISTGAKNYSLTQTSSGNEYYKHAQYTITFSNLPSSGALNTASATLKVSNITSVNVYSGGSAELNGSTLTIALNGWTNSVSFDVEYSSSDFTIE